MNILKSVLQKGKNLTFSSIRNCSHGELEPIDYHGFKYYPRHKDFKDPPITPSKLFLVKRIQSSIAITKEQKKCLQELNIIGKQKNDFAIVQNKPETNALLWKIKHLVVIKPIFWKGELPKDGLNTILRSTGELVIIPKLNITEERINSSEKFPEENHRIRRNYMQSYLLEKWKIDF